MVVHDGIDLDHADEGEDLEVLLDLLVGCSQEELWSGRQLRQMRVAAADVLDRGRKAKS